jgi:hypothetical protein
MGLLTVVRETFFVNNGRIVFSAASVKSRTSVDKPLFPYELDAIVTNPLFSLENNH